MKILMFSDEFPPLGNRRSFVVYYLLKDFAKRNNVEIDLITSSRSSNKKEMFSDNIFIHYMDLGRKGQDSSLNTIEKCIFTVKAIQYALKLLKRKNFDVIHYFSLFTAFFVSLFIKNIFIVNIFPTDMYGKYKTIKRNFVKGVILKSRTIITSCKKDQSEIKKFIPQKDTTLIYSGVETKRFIFNLRTVNKKITLVSVGRMINKGEYDFLINALKGINDYRLIIIGDGNMSNKLEKLSIKTGVDIEFKGRLSHEEIKNVMKKSDIYISVTTAGGISNSMLEAMSMGLPIICYDVGGNNEIINDNGFIIEQNNINELRRALDTYRNNLSMIKKHGKNSKKIADSFSWKKTGESYLKEYEKIISPNIN